MSPFMRNGVNDPRQVGRTHDHGGVYSNPADIHHQHRFASGFFNLVLQLIYLFQSQVCQQGNIYILLNAIAR